MVRTTTLVTLAVASQAYALDLDPSSTDSIKSAASSLAHSVVSYYNGNETAQIPGVLPEPYYWWEGGYLFDILIQYWSLTGDDQYNGIVTQGLQFQRGSNDNFYPTNWSMTEGNDDQTIWALAAMSAAEAKLPESQGKPTWVSLANEVFNDLARRWDTTTCDGGLRWQILPFMAGYDYKNSISTGLFFQLSSRLARYTGNSTYSDWASKSFSWVNYSGFIDEDWNVYDGAKTDTNCSSMNKVQFSYVAGTFISGAAHMYNMTGDAKWRSTLTGLLSNTLKTFFPEGIAQEVACEPVSSARACTTDMHAYKGMLAHWLIDTSKVAPHTAPEILQNLKLSAIAAAETCHDGKCQLLWNGKTAVKTSDLNSTNIGNEMNALSVIQGLLVPNITTATTESPASGSPTSATTSGTSTPTTIPNSAVVLGHERFVLFAAIVGLLYVS